MRDANFLDPRLAPHYDRLNRPREDIGFYVGQAGSPSLSVVDIGCGTGDLALLLAEEGHQVTGIDPAGPMLDVARAADVDQRVEWIQGDVGSLRPGARFDLAVMTGHVFQVFLEDAEVARVLGAIRSHLGPGGRLIFETRNPAVRAWETWVPGKSRRTTTGEDGSTITTEHDVLDVTGELVSFETTHELGATGECIRCQSTLRFMGPETLLGHLAAAGFGTVTLLGDWDGAPFTDTSPEIIVVAL